MKQRQLPGMRGFLGHSFAEPIALQDGEALCCHIPGIQLRSLNQGFRGVSMGARYAMAAKVRAQRQQVTLVLRSKLGLRPPEPPLTITVTRVAPGELDAHDNLPGACKHVVDAIAEWLGLDDRDRRLSWRYEQSRDGRSCGVTIRIEASKEVAA